MKFSISYQAGVSSDRPAAFHLIAQTQQLVNDDAATAVVRVRHYWQDEQWYHYQFCAYIDGEMIQMLTDEQYQQRIQDIRDHENNEVANQWATDNAHCLLWSDERLPKTWSECLSIQRRFQAILELGMFDLSITM